MRIFSAILVGLLFVAPLRAQIDTKQDPLTPDQQEQIAEAGIDPVARVGLYVKFIDEHAETIRSLIKRARSPARSQRLAAELQHFGALIDELGDNLDVYSQREADIRKSLKGLNDGVRRWQGVLHDLPAEPGFDLSLKNAVSSADDLASQTKQLATDQDAYFKAHPDEKDQDRAEPK
jgi:hypothetical protein